MPRMQLVLTVNYDEENFDERIAVENLYSVARLASGEGLLTDASEMTVDTWAADVKRLAKE